MPAGEKARTEKNLQNNHSVEREKKGPKLPSRGGGGHPRVIIKVPF